MRYVGQVYWLWEEFVQGQEYQQVRFLVMISEIGHHSSLLCNISTSE